MLKSQASFLQSVSVCAMLTASPSRGPILTPLPVLLQHFLIRALDMNEKAHFLSLWFSRLAQCPHFHPCCCKHRTSFWAAWWEGYSVCWEPLTQVSGWPPIFISCSQIKSWRKKKLERHREKGRPLQEQEEGRRCRIFRLDLWGCWFCQLPQGRLSAGPQRWAPMSTAEQNLLHRSSRPVFFENTIYCNFFKKIKIFYSFFKFDNF